MASDSQNQGTSRRWQYRQSKNGMAANGAASGKGKQLFVLLAVVLALAGAIIGLLLYLRPEPKPFFLTISVVEYDSKAWPANPFAYNDGKSLIRHFPPDSKDMFNSQVSSRIITELNRLPNDQSRNIVVHLSALALAKNDEVYLLPADGTPDGTNWLPLQSVVTALSQNKSPNKLLILDITHPLSVPKLGIFETDVAAKVENLLQDLAKKKKLPIRVLTACSSHQNSLDIEAIGYSAFGYFLNRGLEGKADGHGPRGSADGKVTVEELGSYVAKHVDQWAVGARNTRQTPTLIGQGEDFVLVNRNEDTEGKTIKLEQRKYPTWLAKGWELRDQWLESEKYRTSTRPFGQLEYLLMQAEQRWLSGMNEEKKKVDKSLEYDVGELEQLISQSEQMPHMVVHSVELVPDTTANTGNSKPKEPAEAKKEETDKPAESKASKLPNVPEIFANLVAKWESGELKKEDWPKTRLEVWKSLEGVPYPKVVSELFVYLLNQGLPKKHQIKLAHELLKEKHSEPVFVEEFMLQDLDELRAFVEDQQKSWTAGGAVFQVLRTFRESTEAVRALYGSPFALSWVEKQMESADKNRQKGEQLLFGDKLKPWSDATSFLKQAEQDYGSIRSNIQIVKQATHSYTDALRLLPAIAEYYARKPDLGADEKRAWRKAVIQTVRLGKLLQTPNPDETSSVRVAHTELLNQLDELVDWIDQKRAAMLAGRLESADKFLQLRSMLTYSGLDQKKRIALWKAISETDQKLLDQSGADIDVGRISLTSLTEKLEKRRRLAVWLNVHQLPLTGLTVSTSLETYLKEQSDDDSTVNNLDDELRSFWQKQLPEKFHSLQENLPAATRLSFFMIPYRDTENWRTLKPEWSHNPSALLANKDAERLLRWMGARYQKEHEARIRWAPKSNYFAKIAAEYPR